MRTTTSSSLAERAALHAALGDPGRLAIIDELLHADRAPVELQQRLHLPSNLLAHHLDVLEQADLVERSRSSGDGRRRYVHLKRGTLDGLGPASKPTPRRALFVCTANSARSQLAAALWVHLTGVPASSAGTHPAAEIHPGAIVAARSAGLALTGATPKKLAADATRSALVITVCDRAHEELAPPDTWLHWSIPDPVPLGTKAAFTATLRELERRMTDFAASPTAAA
jgi:protein-tyrosine-phosphatase/DNA-binding transcriptional ArsR family regulator